MSSRRIFQPSGGGLAVQQTPTLRVRSPGGGHQPSTPSATLGGLGVYTRRAHSLGAPTPHPPPPPSEKLSVGGGISSSNDAALVEATIASVVNLVRQQRRASTSVKKSYPSPPPSEEITTKGLDLITASAFGPVESRLNVVKKGRLGGNTTTNRPLSSGSRSLPHSESEDDTTLSFPSHGRSNERPSSSPSPTPPSQLIDTKVASTPPSTKESSTNNKKLHVQPLDVIIPTSAAFISDGAPQGTGNGSNIRRDDSELSMHELTVFNGLVSHVLGQYFRPTPAGMYTL